MKGNLFSFIARIPTVLRGRQYNYTETMLIGKAKHHLFYFPALANIRSYSVTFIRERLQLLRWFFTWTTHLFSGKKIVFTARGSTSNICYSGKGTLRSVNCDLGGQWAMDRFEE